MDLLLFACVVFLVYANGANDNFKGVATLFGSGVSRYRGALLGGRRPRCSDRRRVRGAWHRP